MSVPYDMVAIPAGRFRMGSDDFYPEERPVRPVAVEAFRIDRFPVTNAHFAEFVAATGYVTVAERPLDPAHYPGADPELLVPGSALFTPPDGPVRLDNHLAWWTYRPGACWRHPEGPGSDVSDRPDHPVVHVAHEDAAAYARWRGASLPTEPEWEYAARGGLDGTIFAWGDDFTPDGLHMANTWQGAFPHENRLEDGYARTSPVGSFPANGYGLHDMIGNVWEWTADRFDAAPAAKTCCSPGGGGAVRRVIKGGSHLCAPNYCLRYRPAARQPEPEDTSTGHLGFRCVVRDS